MSETLKRAGASCPKCPNLYPAEYAQIGQRARWACSCGAGGELIGDVARRNSVGVGESVQSTVKPANPNLGRSRT